VKTTLKNKNLLIGLCAVLHLFLFVNPSIASTEAESKGEIKGSVSAATGKGNKILGDFFLNPALGIAIPMADDDYTEYVGVSFKLAFLTGGFLFHAGPILVGPEIAMDFIPFNIKEKYEDIDLHLYRMRFQTGARIVFPIPKYERVRLIWRFNLGVDVVWGDWEWGRFHEDDSSAGAALDFIGGIEIMVHRMVGVGGYMGLPVSIHDKKFFYEEDYNSLDLDIMLQVTIYPFSVAKKK